LESIIDLDQKAKDIIKDMKKGIFDRWKIYMFRRELKRLTKDNPELYNKVIEQCEFAKDSL